MFKWLVVHHFCLSTYETFFLLFQSTSKYDFAALTPPIPLPYPFDSEYDYSLACDLCFAYTSYGPNGYTSNPKLEHKCSRYTLLVRPKGRYDMEWRKIRPRPPVSCLKNSIRLVSLRLISQKTLNIGF